MLRSGSESNALFCGGRNRNTIEGGFGCGCGENQIIEVYTYSMCLIRSTEHSKH